MKVEVSNGELADKVSILSIKLKKIKSEEKLENIKREYEILVKELRKIDISENDPDYRELVGVNLELWEIEDQIRINEAQKKFDDSFIQLARSVYHKNDLRAAIKRRINIKTHSLLIEEKEYVNYA